MNELLRSTTAYRAIAGAARRGGCAQFTLVFFADEGYLRPLLTECAKAFFGADEGTRAARLIGEEAYADCPFFPPAGGRLTAELAGAVADESALEPVEASKKLIVLDAFHTVTPLVQNKLLKLLEEPPPKVYFLAGAANEHAVLPTVLSRANKITVPPFSEEAVRAALARKYPGRAGTEAAAAACGGVFSAAERLLEGGGEEFRLAERFLLGDECEAVCRDVGEKKRVGFFAAVRLLLRDALLIASGQGRYAAVHSQAAQAIARRFPAGAAIAAAEAAARAERDLQFNANPGQAALALAAEIEEELKKWQK